MNTCKNCHHYQNKDFLGKENTLVKTDYCRHFDQKLTSLKACPRFKKREYELSGKDQMLFSLIMMIVLASIFVLTYVFS